MKIWLFLLFLPIITLCACGISPQGAPIHTEIEDSIPMEPITPSKEITREDRIKNISGAISTIEYLYDKMQNSASDSGASKKALKEATKIDEQYGERIQELFALNLDKLSDEELTELSAEVREIVSALRSVNDLF